jgi:DNA-3-methyladenine glycosylase II
MGGIVIVRLDSEVVLQLGVAALAQCDPVMARLVGEGIRPPLRKREAGLAGLLSIIVAQQVSVASAAAIWRRVQTVFPDLQAAALSAASDEAYRAAGLSGPKIRTIRAIAAAVESGLLPLDSLHAMETVEAHRLMRGVKGIGPWTADIYLLFCLGHPDIFPSGDLALQEAARLAYGLDARPDAAALAEQALGWRPWRGVAAGMLWAYYARVKAREGAPSAT